VEKVKSRGGIYFFDLNCLVASWWQVGVTVLASALSVPFGEVTWWQVAKKEGQGMCEFTDVDQYHKVADKILAGRLGSSNSQGDDWNNTTFAKWAVKS